METGVIYEPRNLAGLFRRCLILVIDGTVLWMSMLPLFMAHAVAGAMAPSLAVPLVPLLCLLWIVTAFLYLTAMKARVGTLGYLLTGTRIVSLNGRQPTVGWMAHRLFCQCFIWWLSPIGPLVDLLWMTGDPQRQTLHDRFARTYVVRRHAAPIVPGRLGTTQLHIFTLTLRLREVRPQPNFA